MTLRVKNVTHPPSRNVRLAVCLSPGTQLLAEFHVSGVMKGVKDLCRLSRGNGHTGGGLFAFAVAFFASGCVGLRSFWETHRHALRRVAAVAGLRALPSSSALSRALSDMDHATARAFADGLLWVDGMETLLRHAAVTTRDALGGLWHVLDFDPTVEAFRQRNLPEGEDLPPPVRRASGSPGYTGHKRGEIRIRHLLLFHPGAGLWLSYRLFEAQASTVELIADAVRNAVAIFSKLVGAPHRVIMRTDGEFGSVGAMRVCLEAGLSIVTRVARYHLLDRPEIRAALAQASWLPVRSSLGKGRREATDLGVFVLNPASGAGEAEGGPVRVRVVASRRPCDGEPDHGVLIGGYQVELFATNLEVEPWPADAIVELYNGRSAIENALAQEDRLFDIGRTFSYNPAGQEWMSAVALFLWNRHTCSGFLANPPPEALKPQECRPAEASEPPPPIDEAPKGVAEQTVADAAPQTAIEPPAAVVLPEAVVTAPEAPRSSEEALERLREHLRQIFAEVAAQPGWSYDAKKGELECPNQQRLVLSTVQDRGGVRGDRVMMRTSIAVCDGCRFRVDCFSSPLPNTYKVVARSVPPELGRELRSALELVRAHRRTVVLPAVPAPNKACGSRPPTSEPAAMMFTPIPPTPPGKYLLAPPMFAASRARHAHRQYLSAAIVEVRLHRRRPADPVHPLLNDGPEATQGRRKTWRQRDEASASDRGATLRISRPTNIARVNVLRKTKDNQTN